MSALNMVNLSPNLLAMMFVFVSHASTLVLLQVSEVCLYFKQAQLSCH